MTDEQGTTWTDEEAAKFLKLKVEDLSTPISCGAHVAIVTREGGERRWSPEKLKKWRVVFGQLCGVSTSSTTTKWPGSGGPRP